MTPEAVRIARQLADLLRTNSREMPLDRSRERAILPEAAHRTRADSVQSPPRRTGLPDQLFCDTLPDPDDPFSWINGHVPHQAQATFRADQASLDRERSRWAPIIRAAAARYGGARRLKARRA